jgi:hypothetical protein
MLDENDKTGSWEAGGDSPLLNEMDCKRQQTKYRPISVPHRYYNKHREQ